jgi:pimeloyl-ACP methyl ester carboxylesterase
MENDMQSRLLFLADRSDRAIRWGHLIVIAAVLAVMNGTAAFAQPPKKPVVEDKTLTTEDNVDIKISYFKSNSGKDAPVIVMLHGKGGNRRQYAKFAADLQAKGDFAVITVDLRGHGESTQLKKGELKKQDYLAMATQDMDAVRDFIFAEHQKEQLNMNKLGIVATEFSASVALTYTELDWEKQPYDDNPNPLQATPRGHDVQALALISPDTSTPGLFANKAASAVRLLPIAVMVGASEKEKTGHDLTNSKKLFDQISVKREKDERLYFAKYPEAVRGMDLILQDATLKAHIYAFLDNHVKKLTIEWRDRRSRADRE